MYCVNSFIMYVSHIIMVYINLYSSVCQVEGEKKKGAFFFFEYSLFLVALGLGCSQPAFSSCDEPGLLFRASHCSGFFCCRTQALGTWAQ